MAKIDRKLSMKGIDIPSRSIHAAREVSMCFDLHMPLGGDPARMPPEIRKNAEPSCQYGIRTAWEGLTHLSA